MLYLRLKEQYELRGWEKLPYALVNRRALSPAFMKRAEFDALRLCSGRVDLDMGIIPAQQRQLALRFEQLGIVERCEPGAGIEPSQEYRLYPARYIRTAHWSVTGRCNYRCRHCYMSAPDAKLGELGHESVMEIVRQLGECGVRSVTLTGGEPLVRRDFMEIVDALLERGIVIPTIYSNGRLVTDALLDALEARGIRPEFNMSYDGPGYHDWLRGVPGAEGYAEAAFLRCRDRGFPTGAELCIFGANKGSLRESVRRLAGWGCRSLKVNPVGNVGAWKEGGYGQAIDMRELFGLYLDYIPQYYEDGLPLTIQLGGFFSASPRRPEQYEIPLMRPCGEPESSCICGHARVVMYISAEGRALPCMALSGMELQKEFPLITEQGLAKCLSDSRSMRFIDTRVSEYLERNTECADCEYAHTCAGGCRASALESEPGALFGPDPYACELFRGGWAPKIRAAAEAAIAKRKDQVQIKENER